MKLTEKEERMLKGDMGRGVQCAMEVLVKMGELYGAEEFIEVKNAHIDAAAYTTIWDAGTEFVEFLVENGARVAVPTTINPMSVDRRNWRNLGTSEEFAAKCDRLENAYMKLGVNPTWTCAPYQCTNVPMFGESVAWSESNAVDYVNSVVGARTERLPDLVDVCCAVAGRVPKYGRYLDENRKGELLFELEGFDDAWFQDNVDYAVLGYLAGEIAINRVPVIKGLPQRTTQDNLKSFSAAAASGGAVSLFHVEGITPEAPTLEAAFQGTTDHPIYELAKIAGYVDVLEAAGAVLVRDSCLMEMEYNGMWTGKHFVTNSGKAAQYAPAINSVKITMADLKGCVKAAVTGKVPEEV